MTFFSENISEISKALAKAQGEMTHASKDSSNPYFKSKYADLAEVWNACRQALSENSLSVIQLLELIDGQPALITILSHSSGQWMKSTAVLPVSKPGAQELGSCITYLRRYSLAAMVGVYQDDDDGEKAQKEHREESKKSERLSKDQIEKLYALTDEINDSDYLLKLEDYLGCAHIELMNPKDFDRTIKSLEKKLKDIKKVSHVA
ncbi:MAG TPA: ERF family protein [Rhabdochlamydiaceae bacterium]|nr:ERF family protein [Rhabdochlamydiaceae bacterium]